MLASAAFGRPIAVINHAGDVAANRSSRGVKATGRPIAVINHAGDVANASPHCTLPQGGEVKSRPGKRAIMLHLPGLMHFMPQRALVPG